MPRAMRVAWLVFLALVAPREAAASETTSVALRAGPYWMVDRDQRMFDGPSAALSGELAIGRGWGAVLELGTAGEYAGGRGTCLGELSVQGGPSWSFAPGPAWLHVVFRGGPGVVWARLYGSLLGSTTATAYGDRVLPDLWSSVGAAAHIGRFALSVDLIGRWVPSATFHADHVPDGAMPEFYPTFRRAHDLSAYGVMGGFAFHF